MQREKLSTDLLRPALALLATVALLLVLGSPVQRAEALEQRPLCEVCRRYIDTSPGACNVRIIGERHVKNIDACSPFCLFELLEDNKLEGEQMFSVALYESLAEDDTLMFNVRQAKCLYGASDEEELSHEPHLYYFMDEDEAREMKKERGGEILEWSEVAERCRKLAEDYEPESKDSYRPLKKRGRSKSGD